MKRRLLITVLLMIPVGSPVATDITSGAVAAMGRAAGIPRWSIVARSCERGGACGPRGCRTSQADRLLGDIWYAVLPSSERNDEGWKYENLPRKCDAVLYRNPVRVSSLRLTCSRPFCTLVEELLSAFPSSLVVACG
jgi:hypothetical protein